MPAVMFSLPERVKLKSEHSGNQFDFGVGLTILTPIHIGRVIFVNDNGDFWFFWVICCCFGLFRSGLNDFNDFFLANPPLSSRTYLP